MAEKTTQRKKKRSVWKIILIVAIVLIIGGFVLSRFLGKQAEKLPIIDTTPVLRTDLENSIQVDGVVESKNSEKILPEYQLRVKENMVEVGDIVKQGDVLCVLDTKDLEHSIEQQKATANVSDAANHQSVAVAQKQYDNARSNVAENKDAQIFQAEQALEQAEQMVTQAEQAVRTAESSVKTAGMQFRSAQDRVDDARAEADWDGYELQDFNTNELVNARELAYHQYEMAKDGVNDAKQALENAKEGVKNAEKSLEIVKTSTQQQIDSMADSVRSAQIAARSTESSHLAIGHAEEDLEGTTLVSPVDGVVTAVYVTEGAVPTGLMYVIEDVNHLKIATTIKEYDLPNIEEGTPAEIKSEVSGENVYTGAISTIAPTSLKNELGGALNPSDPEFKVEIDVTGADTELLIGTKARVNLFYEKKDGALAIPISAIASDDTGQDIVYVLKEEYEGVYRVTSVPVVVGMETDALIEISSDAIAEGDEVVAISQNVNDGDFVKKGTAGEIMPDLQDDIIDSPVVFGVGKVAPKWGGKVYG